MSNPLQLQEPLKDGGIRSVNFFNGRLLASNDLSREQTARRESDWRLGLAIGDGVAFGYEVDQDKSQSTPAAPVLRITAGLAVNRLGQALRLANDVSVALTRSFGALGGNCLFTNCVPLTGGTYVAGAGIYLLTVAPAETSEGRAATNGLNPANVRCNTDATVEAVQFRLLAVISKHYADFDPFANQFRNRLAYRCFGVEERNASLADPRRIDPVAYGLIDALRTEGLNDADVPLAIFFWSSGGVQFIDMWAVRRRLVPRSPAAAWHPQFAARHSAEAQAMFHQFQDQIDGLLGSSQSDSAIESLKVTDYFRYLPAAALIPTNGGGARGFAVQRFLSGVTYRQPFFIEGAKLHSIFDRSLSYAPIDLTSGELVWTYLLRQNIQAIDSATGSTPQQYVILASGHMPFEGEARFDLNHWNYANFS